MGACPVDLFLDLFDEIASTTKTFQTATLINYLILVRQSTHENCFEKTFLIKQLRCLHLYFYLTIDLHVI